MTTTTIFSYLVQPNKGAETKIEPIGSSVPVSEQIGTLLCRLADEAEDECDIPIMFSIGDDGIKFNEMHNLVIKFCGNPTMDDGEVIATRLSISTSKTSGQCLLFLIHSIDDQENVKLVMSRFPAEFGILAENADEKLQLEFVEQVFMKSHDRYKAAIFKGKPVVDSLWVGKATDTQTRNSFEELANYWVYDFLNCAYKDTSSLGTKRFAVALKKAVNSANDSQTRAELVSIAQQTTNFKMESLSIDKILDYFAVSDNARSQISKHLPNPATSKSEFIFNREEFLKNVRYTSLALDTGVIITAPSEKFNELVNSKNMSQDGEFQIEIILHGKIVDQNLRKTL